MCLVHPLLHFPLPPQIKKSPGPPPLFITNTKTPRDINCGNAFQAAIDDTTLGGLNLCTRGNPNVGVTPPTTGLVCTGGAKKVRRGDDDEGDDEERDDDREGDDDEGDDKNEG